MHRCKSSSTLLYTMRTVDCMVAKLYAYTGCLQDMAALKEALLISGIRNICPALNMLAQCRYSYELGSASLHHIVATDDVEQLKVLLPRVAFNNPNVKIFKHVTLLHVAVLSGAINCLKYLLSHPRLICLTHTLPDDFDHNVLTLAISKPLPCPPAVRLEMIRAIIACDKRGALLRRQVGAERRNALMLALTARNSTAPMILNTVELLLSAPHADASFVQQDFVGCTALMMACRNEANLEFAAAFELVKKMLAADPSGKALRVQCAIGWSALMYVLENGGTYSSGAAVRIAKYILETHPDHDLLSQKTQVGNSILALLMQFNGLCEYDLVYTIRLLLNADASRTLAACQNKDHWTALMYACYNLSRRSGACVYQIVSLLTEFDGTKKLHLAQDNEGWTALMVTCLTGYGLNSKQKRALIELLLDCDAAGVTVSQTTSTGWNALMIICRNKLLNLNDSDVCAVIRRLVALDPIGNSVSVINQFGWNALMILCRNKAHYHSSILERCINELLKSPNATTAVRHRTPNGSSVLLLLCQRKCFPEQRMTKMVHQLIGHGALNTLDWVNELHGAKKMLEDVCTLRRKTRAQKLDYEEKLISVIKITRLLSSKAIETTVINATLGAPL